jgi:murein DD-endopeptidase MepM/ murein hydrolase activator NlpD
MRCLTENSYALSCSRLALVAGLAFGIAGCSSDMSRLSDNSYTSSNGRPAGDVTGSVQPKPATGSINSNTLPPPAASQPVPVTTYNLPSNTPTPPPPVSPVATNATVKQATSPAPSATGAKQTYVVVAGDTLHKIARQYQISVSELLAANNLAPHTKLKLGSQLIIPTARAPQPAAPKTVTNLKPDATPPAANIRKITPTQTLPAENKDATATTSLSFRWPVRARVVGPYGTSPSGQENHGINLSVPEGTPIKASEEGVVAYAGNELKTYGNLVLIRHANGFVTAYAHCSEILVKRDEVIKRGQVIAKSGQTGNVPTPQLHFEIRKGSTPVDPMTYLDRAPQA